MNNNKNSKDRYIVEINDWGCGILIKDTLTGKEIDAPAEETVNLCLAEMNRLAAEADALKLGSLLTAVDVLQFINLKAEVERLTDCKAEADRLKAEVERLRKAIESSPVAQLKLKELEGKTTYEQINGKKLPS